MQKSLPEWLDWMEQIHPSEIELGLDRVYDVALRLGLAPLDAGGARDAFSEPSLRVATNIIVVAGTNGKGSTIATLQHLCEHAGLSTCVYTSPHFEHYSERFEFDGNPVSDTELCSVLAQIEFARGSTALTFFEFSTLAALLLCRQRKPDVAILEVGLGGRLDAINIVPADIAVITQIDLDHQDWLGDTRELIGAEKAGILRPGIKFVCADLSPPSSIRELARTLQADSYFLSEDFEISRRTDRLEWHSKKSAAFVFHDPGLHPSSIAAALQVLELLTQESVTKEATSKFNVLALPGRQQALSHAGVSVLLDVAHNPAATIHLRNCMQRSQMGQAIDSTADGAKEIRANRTLAVFAVMADKDWQTMVSLISDVIDGWFLAELPGNQRAEANKAIEAYLKIDSPAVSTASCSSVDTAIKSALSEAQPGDNLVVFGSFFTVAAALKYFKLVGSLDG
ncbi:MAG: folylpolyglutamate synthase/dihydrofolate synthase family protein [Pseudomonadales bacterium]